jgi:hypothetical protein
MPIATRKLSEKSGLRLNDVPAFDPVLRLLE